MATVAEAIGLALPHACGAPAPHEMRDRFIASAKNHGADRQNIRPRDIVTLKALENAATVVSATGGSTNAAIHLPAIAHEAGIKFDLFDVAIFEKTPYRRFEAGGNMSPRTCSRPAAFRC
jgi:dihydroxy-acid dehydratase